VGCSTISDIGCVFGPHRTLAFAGVTTFRNKNQLSIEWLIGGERAIGAGAVRRGCMTGSDSSFFDGKKGRFLLVFWGTLC